MSSHGLLASGDNANFHFHGTEANEISAQRVPTTDPVDSPQARLAQFVITPRHADLVARLGHRWVVELVGAERSGRFTAAFAALARRPDVVEVDEIHLPSGLDPHHLMDHAGLLHKGHGYVVRLGDVEADGLMRRLTRLFERAEARAVLIRTGRASDEADHKACVRHEPPTALDVFTRHLVVGLRDECVDGCDECHGCGRPYADSVTSQPEVQAALTAVRQPRIGAETARRVIAMRPRGLEEVIGLLPDPAASRRKQARDILEAGIDQGGDLFRFDQHRRALRVAYATLSGRPYAQVSEAAGLLLAHVDDRFAHPFRGRPSLTHHVEAVLGDQLVELGRHSRSTDPRASRVAYADHDLVVAVLDVAWNDFDNTQPVLIEWIQRLVEHPGDGFAQAATRAAMVFAFHDFDLIRDRLLRPWARHRRVALRHIAAVTIASAAKLSASVPSLVSAHGRIDVPLDDFMVELAFGGGYGAHTAALAWASGYPPRRPASLAAALTSIAGREPYASALTDAVEAVAEKVDPAWIISLLGRWADSKDPAVRRQAARSFLRLAARFGPDRLELLNAPEPGSTNVADVARLWQLVLVDSASAAQGSLSVRAWQTLADWLREARRDERQTELLGALLRRLATEPAVAKRLQHWLSRGSNGWSRLSRLSPNEGQQT